MLTSQGIRYLAENQKAVVREEFQGYRNAQNSQVNDSLGLPEFLESRWNLSQDPSNAVRWLANRSRR